MRANSWYVLPVLGVLFLGVTQWLPASTGACRFADGRELRTFAAFHGFHTHNDGTASTSNFSIADRPLSAEELVAVCGHLDGGGSLQVAGHRLGGATRRRHDRSAVGASRRSLAALGQRRSAGDEALMDQLEALR